VEGSPRPPEWLSGFLCPLDRRLAAPEQEQSGAENEPLAVSDEPSVSGSWICDSTCQISKEREEERVEHDLRGCFEAQANS